MFWTNEKNSAGMSHVFLNVFCLATPVEIIAGQLSQMYCENICLNERVGEGSVWRSIPLEWRAVWLSLWRKIKQKFWEQENILGKGSKTPYISLSLFLNGEL